MDAKVTTIFFKGEVLWRWSFLGNLKALDKKIDRWRTPIWIEYFYCHSIFSIIPSLASNNHVLGWNSWPTNALLHHSVKRPLHIYTVCVLDFPVKTLFTGVRRRTGFVEIETLMQSCTKRPDLFVSKTGRFWGCYWRGARSRWLRRPGQDMEKKPACREQHIIFPPWGN